MTKRGSIVTEQVFSPSEWLTTREVAELTGYKRVSIRHALLSGALHGEKRGRDWFIRKSDAIEYAKRMQNLGTQKHTPKSYRDHQSENEVVDKWITSKEAENLTGYSRHTFIKAAKRGALGSIKRGNMLFYKQEEILAYVERMRKLGRQKHTPKIHRDSAEQKNA